MELGNHLRRVMEIVHSRWMGVVASNVCVLFHRTSSHRTSITAKADVSNRGYRPLVYQLLPALQPLVVGRTLPPVTGTFHNGTARPWRGLGGGQQQQPQPVPW